jgi:NitT/TauT family transport system substrate-binding protein
MVDLTTSIRTTMTQITKTLLICLMLTMTLTAGVAAQSDRPFRLIVTHLEPPLVPNSVMDLAVTLGYFEREGVDVELVRVQQTPSALAALRAGDGEMANIGVDAMLLAMAAGATDLRAVTSPNKSLPFLIVARDPIQDVKALQGASFGIGRIGSLDHSLSQLVIARLGGNLEASQVVTLGQPNIRAQALLAGQVDATTMSIGTWSVIPDTTGLNVVVDQDAYFAAAPLVNKANVVSTRVLSERPQDVEAVIRALIRISRDFATDPELWVEAMRESLPENDPIVLHSLASSFAGSWSVNGGMSARELAETSDWLFSTADFAGLPPIELRDWVDFGPADRALEALGVIEGLDPADR